MALSRREFVLRAAWGLVAVSIRPAFALETGGDGWSGGSGAPRYRIDGLAKVTGAKIYARDYRARDFGWGTERVAMVARAARIDAPVLGFDTTGLPDDVVVIRQSRLAADGVNNLFPDTSPPQSLGRAAGFLVEDGELPAYGGQPVALVVFTSAAQARRVLGKTRLSDRVQFGEVDPPLPYDAPYPSPLYLTRYPSDDPGVDAFSRTRDGTSDPYTCDADDPTSANCRAAGFRQRIADDLAQASAKSWKVFRGTYTTQVLDPMFMEPESGLAYVEEKDGKRTLHLVIGTQSPDGDVADVAALFGEKTAHGVDEVTLYTCYPGGGFGGRDVSLFSPLLILSAMYAGGPVRMAFDRFEQFQSGIKQLGSTIAQTLAVDGEGRFQLVQAEQKLKAGGKNNYSQFVAELAGFCASGAYAIPRAAVDAMAIPTPGVVAGSMRGFGGPQAHFAIELLVEKAARELGKDPIAFRRDNVLKKATADRTVTGAPVTQVLALDVICDRAAAHALWAGREAERARYEAEGLRYGVGFALANQAYGTGSDGVMAAVVLSPEGSIQVLTNAVDMGNGSATTLAAMTEAALGAAASSITIGDTSVFASLGLSSTPGTTQSPKDYRKRGARHHASVSHQWENPRYTPSFSMSSSACITAFQQVHAVRQASRVLFLTGIWPAATALWGIAPATPSDNATWVDGKLQLDGHEPLDMERLAARIQASKGVDGGMVHAYFAGRWVQADYDLAATGNPTTATLPVDGICTRRSGGAFRPIWRKKTRPPPIEAKNYGRSLYAPSGTLAAVTVDPRSGEVRVVAAHTWLNAGRILNPGLVEGIYQGGFAMGVGYALLEDLSEDLAIAGTLNLTRYRVAMARDIPLDRLGLTLLQTEEDDARGIAEAVLCPVPPAIVNAITAATGHAFTRIPVTAAQIRAALEAT